MSLRPDVSVILPFHNGSAWLPRAIESVRLQEGVRWELLVVDDGSEENPLPIIGALQDRRVRCLRFPHAGKGAALNHGLRNAAAPVVCFLDQDDVMLPGRLSLQMEALEREPDLDGVYSDYERRRQDGRPIDRFISRQATPEEALHLTSLGRSPVSMQNLLLRKRCIEALGGFTQAPELNGLDDAEFFVRLFLSHPRLRYVPGMVQAWVLHEKNFSRSAAFHEARLHWLRRLRGLAARYPELHREIDNFVFHARTMRGIFFLERRRSREAFFEFLRAARARPLRLNNTYLLFKALAGALLPSRPRASRPPKAEPLP